MRELWQARTWVLRVCQGRLREVLGLSCERQEVPAEAVLRYSLSMTVTFFSHSSRLQRLGRQLIGRSAFVSQQQQPYDLFHAPPRTAKCIGGKSTSPRWVPQDATLNIWRQLAHRTTHVGDVVVDTEGGGA